LSTCFINTCWSWCPPTRCYIITFEFATNICTCSCICWTKLCSNNTSWCYWTCSNTSISIRATCWIWCGCCISSTYSIYTCCYCCSSTCTSFSKCFTLCSCSLITCTWNCIIYTSCTICPASLQKRITCWIWVKCISCMTT
jgi:hypothetical protein